MEASDCSVPNLLRLELERRKLRNAAYSVRAFARDLDLSVAFLSQILAGHRNLSEKRAHQVSLKLGLLGKNKELFLALTRYSLSSDPFSREERLRDVSNVGGRQFSI